MDNKSIFFVFDESKACRYRPATMEEYAEQLMAKPRPGQMSSRVGLLTLSTVFLFIEHPGGMLFETMCFCDHGSFDDSQLRYATYAEAKAGHEACLKRLKSKYELILNGEEECCVLE